MGKESKFWWEYGKVGILYTVDKNVNGTTTMENNMIVPQKVKNKITKLSSNSTSGNISKRTESKFWKRYLHSRVYRIIIHNIRNGLNPDVHWWRTR